MKKGIKEIVQTFSNILSNMLLLSWTDVRMGDEGEDKDKAKGIQEIFAGALDCHKTTAKYNRKECTLDIEFGRGILPVASSMT
eukprot:6447375-Ditylum_brightwellii.AAC.1